jgi:hypothetical protein
MLVSQISQIKSCGKITLNQIAQIENSQCFEIPEFQRPLIDEDPRIKAISQYIIDNVERRLFNLGMLTISYREGKYRVIDGQHRIRAINNSIAYLSSDNLNISIHISLYTRLSIHDEKELFRNINKGVSVPKLYVDEHKLEKYYDAVSVLFNETFTNRLSPTRACRAPNINLTALLEQLQERKIVKILLEESIISSPDDLVNKIKSLNNYMKMVLNGDSTQVNYKRHSNEYQKPRLNNLLKKIESDVYACYLGTVPLCRWVEFIHYHNRY